MHPWATTEIVKRAISFNTVTPSESKQQRSRTPELLTHEPPKVGVLKPETPSHRALLAASGPLLEIDQVPAVFF